MTGETISILVVEDEPAHLDAVRRAFHAAGAGFSVRSAASLREYREQAGAEPPDIALLDLLLPDGCAVEALGPPAVPYPIVIMTSRGDEGRAVQALKSGALDYIVKSAEAFADMPRAVERALREWALIQGRIAAERSLRESEERFRRVSTIATDIAYSCSQGGDARFSIDWMIGAAERITGYSDQEIQAQASWRFLVNEADLALFDNNVDGLAPGGQGSCEFRIRHKNGTMVWIASFAECVLEPQPSGRLRLYGSLADITNRKRREQELQERNDELARFSYAVSHDLKSPLVTVQTFLGYLEADLGRQDAAGVAKDLGFIRTAAGKMSCLLDELLDLARVGRRMNPPTEAPLQEVAREALRLAGGRLAARGVEVSVTRERHILFGDQARLVEVFLNLVDNAAKFMGEQPRPRVEIGVEMRGSQTVFFVRDNGMGIDPRHKDKLFGLFEKLDPGTEGTGMGLTLARRIVEVHGGRMWMESKGPGQGAAFLFTLANTRRASGAEAGS